MRGQLTLVLLGTLLVSFLALTITNTYFHYLHVQHADRVVAEEIARHSADTIKALEVSDSALGPESEIDRVLKVDSISAIAIFSHKDHIARNPDTSSAEGEKELMSIKAAAKRLESGSTLKRMSNDRMYFAITRISSIDGQRVTVAVETIERNFKSIFFTLVLDELPVIIVIFVACACVVPLIVRRMISPIQVLTNASREIAAGSFDVDIPIRRRDEIGILADALRHMVRTIRNNMSRIHELAFVDTVSGLSNRAHFRAELEMAFTKKEPITLFFIDLDHFKKVNDTLGHDWGDRLLRAVGGRFTNTVNDHVRDLIGMDSGSNMTLGEIGEPITTTISRLGGDEFAIALSGTHASRDVTKLAYNLLRAVEVPLSIGGTSVVVGASIGVAVAPQDGESASSLLKSADLAMYQAKKNGRGGVVMYEHELKRVAQNRLSLESDLRHALDRDELIAYYQPKVDCRSGLPIGLETLARWYHADKGFISPDLFISVAEESGLILDLGRCILHKSCRQAREWADSGLPIQVGVNVSMAQFSRGDFQDIVLEAIDETGIEPAMLELEITESMAMVDPDDLIRKANPLRKMGIKFALDDFGTGYSSLGQLSALPFDIFKIDRSFITDMLDDQQARIIVRTILAMARSLNYKTVAEGVETYEQLALLSKSGCGAAQGYLFSGPMPSEDVPKWLDKHRHTDISVLRSVNEEFAVDWAG